MKATMFMLGLLTMSLHVGCKDGGAPAPGSDEVDPQLVGAWYYRDTFNISYPSPSIAFRGMQISADKRITSLGIETETGRVATTEETFTKQMLHANDGVLIVQYVAAPGILTDTSHYRVERDMLFLTGRYTSSIHHRTQLGSAFGTPTQSAFSVNIDSIEVHSPSVAASPPAYVSRTSQSTIRLQADIPNGWIFVDIDSFSGTGTYVVGANNGVLTQMFGDVVLWLATDSSLTGTLTIEQYDEVSNRCSGRFGFTVRHGVGPDPQLVRRLHNGTFSVPVYR